MDLRHLLGYLRMSADAAWWLALLAAACAGVVFHRLRRHLVEDLWFADETLLWVVRQWQQPKLRRYTFYSCPDSKEMTTATARANKISYVYFILLVALFLLVDDPFILVDQPTPKTLFALLGICSIPGVDYRKLQRIARARQAYFEGYNKALEDTGVASKERQPRQDEGN